MLCYRELSHLWRNFRSTFKQLHTAHVNQMLLCGSIFSQLSATPLTYSRYRKIYVCNHFTFVGIQVMGWSCTGSVVVEIIKFSCYVMFCFIVTVGTVFMSILSNFVKYFEWMWVCSVHHDSEIHANNCTLCFMLIYQILLLCYRVCFKLIYQILLLCYRVCLALMKIHRQQFHLDVDR